MSPYLAGEQGNAHREDGPRAAAPTATRESWPGWYEARSGRVEEACYLWAQLGTWCGLCARPRGVAPADGQQEWGWEEGRADLPAGRGATGSWQVPLLLPKETHSEGLG